MGTISCTVGWLRATPSPSCVSGYLCRRRAIRCIPMMSTDLALRAPQPHIAMHLRHSSVVSRPIAIPFNRCPYGALGPGVLQPAWRPSRDTEASAASGNSVPPSSGNDELWAKGFPSYMQRSPSELKRAFPCEEPRVIQDDGTKAKWSSELLIWRTIRWVMCECRVR